MIKLRSVKNALGTTVIYTASDGFKFACLYTSKQVMQNDIEAAQADENVIKTWDNNDLDLLEMMERYQTNVMGA